MKKEKFKRHVNILLSLAVLASTATCFHQLDGYVVVRTVYNNKVADNFLKEFDTLKAEYQKLEKREQEIRLKMSKYRNEVKEEFKDIYFKKEELLKKEKDLKLRANKFLNIGEK